MTLRPGDAPPPFTLADLSGRRVGSDTLAGGASVVLFWSTWSPRSAEMFDDFKRHAAAYAGSGLKIVAINIDGENLGPAQKSAIREYIDRAGAAVPGAAGRRAEDLLLVGRHGPPHRGGARCRREYRLRPAGLSAEPAGRTRGGDQESARHGRHPAARDGGGGGFRAAGGWRCSTTIPAASCSPRAITRRRSKRSAAPPPPTPDPSRPPS